MELITSLITTMLSPLIFLVEDFFAYLGLDANVLVIMATQPFKVIAMMFEGAWLYLQNIISTFS